MSPSLSGGPSFHCLWDMDMSYFLNLLQFPLLLQSEFSFIDPSTILSPLLPHSMLQKLLSAEHSLISRRRFLLTSSFHKFSPDPKRKALKDYKAEIFFVLLNYTYLMQYSFAINSEKIYIFWCNMRRDIHTPY